MGAAAPAAGSYAPPGNDCPTCYAAGLAPRWVTLTFAGMAKCSEAFCEDLGPPQNGAFLCEQLPNHPCRYAYPVEEVACAWLASVPAAGSVAFFDQIEPSEEYFYGVDVAKCIKSFSNVNFCSGQPYDCYFGGTCVVSHGAVSLIGWLQHTAGFEPSEDALHDVFEVEESTDEVVRIVDQKTPTNIKIRYSYP